MFAIGSDGLLSSEEEIIALIRSVSEKMNEYNEGELIAQAQDKVEPSMRFVVGCRLIAIAGSDGLVSDYVRYHMLWCMMDALIDTNEDRLKHIMDMFNGENIYLNVLWDTQFSKRLTRSRIRKMLQVIKEHHRLNIDELRLYIQKERKNSIEWLDELYLADV